MADVLGEVGKRVELRMAYGAAFGPERLTVALADGTLVDLTGATFRADLWRPGDPLNTIEHLDAVLDAPEGVLISLPANRLSALAALDSCKKDPLKLEWALYVTLPAGSAQRTHYGPVAVYLGATP